MNTMTHIKRIKEFGKPVFEKKGLDEVLQYYDDAKNSLWNYVSGYTVGDINKDLRKGVMSKQLKGIVERIDSLMQMDEVKVYRTVDWDYMKNIYNITKDNIDEEIGKVFTAKAYTSTTREFKSVWGSRWSDNELCMEITSKGKVNCVAINSVLPPEDIDCSEQEEVLLQRNLNFTIDGYGLMSDKGKIGKGDIYLLKVTVFA